MLEANYERAVCLGIVEKLSGMGYSYNKRLLCLYDGVLSYYSKIPADAENGGMDMLTFMGLNLKPKLAIEAKYIKSVRAADKSLKKKKNFVFVVEFRKSAFMNSSTPKKEKKENEKSAKNEQALQWVFAVNDEGSFDKWISLIEQVKTSETIRGTERSVSPLPKRQNAIPAPENPNEKSLAEKRPGPIKTLKPRQNSTMVSISPPKTRDDSETRDISPGKSSFATGDKSKKGRRVQIKEVPNVYPVAPEDIKFEDRLMKKEEELRRERERDEETRRKLEEERELRRQEELARAREELAQEEKLKQEYQEKLRIAWEYKYNLLMDENLKALLSIEDRIRTGFQLLRFIGNFRTEAVNLCKSIIDELSSPPNERKFATYEKTGLDKSVKASQRVFFFGGIIVRMAWAERESVDLGEDGYHYLYTDKVIKSYNHEFRAMDILNDVLYSLNKNHKDVVYRVPLAVKVDYKGFKCLVISSPPVEGDETLQLGPMMSTGTYRVNKNIDDDLNFIARELNLKEHTFVLDDNSTEVNIALSVFTEIHKVVFSGYEDGNEIKNPTSSEAKLSFADRRVHDCFYFMKTADLFPVDIDLEANKNPSFLRRLRPEFLVDHDGPLSADALINNTGDNSMNENDDIEVAQAGIYLRTVVVPAFVKKLDSLELILVDSASLTEALHCHGINIRYVGLICQQTNLPHVKEVCITEMISRTAKKILSKELSDIVLQNSDGENESLSTSKERSGFLGRPSKPSSKQEEVKKAKGKNFQKAAEIEQDIGDCVIELLNLIFGKGKESSRFWSEIMIDQIMYDFNYDIKNFQKTEISLGGLLLAVVHHCNINLKWDSSIEELLDKVPYPFTKSCYEGLKARSKVYSMHSLDVKSLSERYKQARASKEYDAAIKSCLLAMSIDKQMAVKGEGFEDPVLLGDMAEVFYENSQFDKAYEMAKEGLKHSRTLHVEAVKCFCVLMRVHMIRSEMESTLKNFEQAIQHLNFHVGLYHPMHATVYSILGSYYAQKENFQDALFLYKASLVCCMRVLGPNHPYTGEVYLDLGNLTLKMRQQEDALNYFEKAFYVFEASKGEDSIECASTSYMMATLLMSFGKIKEAMTTVQHAMKVYEKNEEDYVERIAECCLLVCTIGESKNDDKLTLEHANKIWNILNKMPTKNSMYYKSRILTLTLTALIHGLTTDKKNFLYIISDAIVDVLGQENKLDKLNGNSEDTTLQKLYLEIIFSKSQASKNIQNLIKDILKTLFMKLQEKDLKAFFRDYRRNLEALEDSQLKECLIDFEMLIFIHGIQYLNDAFKKF